MKLKELRGKQTQEQIAKYLGIGRTAYNLYENEKRQPTPETLWKMADYFNVTLDELLGREFAPVGKTPAVILTDDEKKIIDIYRWLPQSEKSRVVEYLEDKKEFVGRFGAY